MIGMRNKPLVGVLVAAAVVSVSSKVVKAFSTMSTYNYRHD